VHNEIIASPGFLSGADAAFGDSDWVLMHDKAHFHICKVMVKTLSDTNVSVLANWSRYSLASIIIYVIYVLLKRCLETQHPKHLDELINVWDNWCLVTIKDLVAQIPARMARVIAADSYTFAME
jgi:hypothetical protein